VLNSFVPGPASLLVLAFPGATGRRPVLTASWAALALLAVLAVLAVATS
jgi:hypothetical protein